MWSAARTFGLSLDKSLAFVDMLNDVRWGQPSEHFIPKFHQLSRKVVYEDGIGPTEL